MDVSAPTATVGDSTSETTIFTKTIAGGTLTTGALRFRFHIKCRNNTAGSKTPTVRVKYAGSTRGAFAVSAWVEGNAGGAGARGTSYLYLNGIIQSVVVNTTQAQCYWWKYHQLTYDQYDSGVATPPAIPTNPDNINTSTSAVNTSVDQALAVTFQWDGSPSVDPSAQCVAAYVELLQP